jgi:hypothetical protein
MFFNVQMLGEPLGKRLCEGLVFLKIALEFLSINKTARQNQMEIFETIDWRRVSYSKTDPAEI